MIVRALTVIAAIVGAIVAAATIGVRAEVGTPGITVVLCPNQIWKADDPQFASLSGARAIFGAYEGGLYRIEVPTAWNGDLVLYAHGFVDDRSPDGSRLRVGFPAAGQAGEGPTLREHLIAKGFAWAASSYRCFQRMMRIPGHCGFSRSEQTRAFDDLVTWVRGGTRPDGDDVLADVS